jgi:hypothetical protein
MSDTKEFQESFKLDIIPPNPILVTDLYSLLIDSGFTFRNDVASYARFDKCEPWQHDSIVETEVYYNGEEVYDFDEGRWSSMALKYLVASLPFYLHETYLDITFSLAERICSSVYFQGSLATRESAKRNLTSIRDDLLASSGAEPGSEVLAIAIFDSYRKRAAG